jgi:hypothetical protein
MGLARSSVDEILPLKLYSLKGVAPSGRASPRHLISWDDSWCRFILPEAVTGALGIHSSIREWKGAGQDSRCICADMCNKSCGPATVL